VQGEVGGGQMTMYSLLFADVSLATDEVSGTVDCQPERQDQLLQKTRLALLQKTIHGVN